MQKAKTKQQRGQPAVQLAQQVAVNVTYTAGAPGDGIVIVVLDPARQGPTPADLFLGPGEWQVNFTLTNTDGSVFSEGPFLIGNEIPEPTDPYPTAFPVTKTGKSTVSFTCTIADANEATYCYAIRVTDPGGTVHIHDPKVINRGNPTEGKVPPLID